MGCVWVLPFYVPASPPLAIISAIFLFFLQKGSLNRNNSFARKVKATVCWHPDTRVRSGCIEREKGAKDAAIDSSRVVFYCQLSDWGEQPSAFCSAVMIIIIFNTCYRWGHRSSSKCHIHCLLRPLCYYYTMLYKGGRGAREGLRRGSKGAEEEGWGLSSFKCQK